MRLLMFAAATAGSRAAAGKAEARTMAGGVHAFFYLWYGEPSTDGGEYRHWNHEVLPHWTEATQRRFPHDLRSYFLLAELLATERGDEDGAAAQLASAKAAALAATAAAQPPVPQLAATWLARIAHAYCQELRRFLEGAATLELALEHDPSCLATHRERRVLEACRACARGVGQCTGVT